VQPEREQDDADISGEAPEQLPAEHRGQVEHEAGDGERGEADNDSDQAHRHVQYALDRVLQAVRGGAVHQQQADAEDQGEEHHGENVVFGGRRDDVVGDDLEQGVDDPGLLPAGGDDLAGPLALRGQQSLGLRRIDADARLEKIGGGERDGDRDRRQDDGEIKVFTPIRFSARTSPISAMRRPAPRRAAE